MKKFFKNKEEARQFRREIIVPILIDCGIVCIEAFIADALIPGYIAVNKERLQTKRGKIGFIAGCAMSYPALVGINLLLSEKIAEPLNEAIDDFQAMRDAKKFVALYAKGFTCEEIAKACDMPVNDVVDVIYEWEQKAAEERRKARAEKAEEAKKAEPEKPEEPEEDAE